MGKTKSLLRHIISFFLLFVFMMPCFTAAAETAKKDFETASPEDVGLSSERLGRLDDFANELIDNHKTGGIVMLIARRGKIVYHKAFGYADIESGTKLTTDYLFRLYSMTKPITSVALLTLYEQGKFKLTDPIDLYIPAFKDVKVFKGIDDKGDMILEEPKRMITIQDVFRHTAGFSYGFGEGPIDKAYQDAGIFIKLESLTELVDKLTKLPLLYQPGEKWVYSVSYDVLAYLVENLSGMPFDKYCTENIFKPLGMKDTVFGIPSGYTSRFPTVYGPSETGSGISPVDSSDETSEYAYFTKHPFGGTSLSSTAIDFLKFAQMLVNKGELNGVRILGEKTVELMTSNHLPKEIPEILLPDGGSSGYGLGVSSVNNIASSGNLNSVGNFGWGGAASTSVMMDPKEEMVFLFFTQYMPSGFDIESKFQTVVYQAVVD